jgi:hypothetical protein
MHEDISLNVRMGIRNAALAARSLCPPDSRSARFIPAPAKKLFRLSNARTAVVKNRTSAREQTSFGLHITHG